MKVVVFAYNVLGLIGLKSLLNSGFDVAALVTHEDDPNEKIYFDSVAEFAKTKGIPVFTPSSPNTSEFIVILNEMKPDAIFSFYYRQMISQKILDTVNGKAYNLHGSLLPKYRGRCPINWAILNGETEHGVTLHVMVKSADAGDIVDMQSFPILDTDNAGTVQPKMAEAAKILLKRALPLILNGKEELKPQDASKSSYFGGRKPEDGKIDWNKTAKEIKNLIRAVTDPFPGAYTYLNSQKLIIWEAEFSGENKLSDYSNGQIISLSPLSVLTSYGHLIIKKCQFEGDSIMSADSFAQKYSLSVGTILKDS